MRDKTRFYFSFNIYDYLLISSNRNVATVIIHQSLLVHLIYSTPVALVITLRLSGEQSLTPSYTTTTSIIPMLHRSFLGSINKSIAKLVLKIHHPKMSAKDTSSQDVSQRYIIPRCQPKIHHPKMSTKDTSYQDVSQRHIIQRCQPKIHHPMMSAKDTSSQDVSKRYIIMQIGLKNAACSSIIHRSQNR